MKKVLYLTNIEVPYRVAQFNELAKHCELTVLYERERSSNRDDKWAKSEKGNYKKLYLGGIKVGNESAFSLRILKHLFGKYDSIIVGCYNSPVQMFAILIMRIFRIPYIFNTDGEVFVRDKSFKSMMKKFFMRGAKKYLIAGETAAESVRKIIKKREVIAYPFTTLTEKELSENAKYVNAERNDTVLVLGQYFDYKGMDVALKTAKLDPNRKYKFVGMGKRSDLFVEEQMPEPIANVEIIPFLQKEELSLEYQSCAMLLLPTRQECWGLVVNEAASYGMPIVSTWGSGAAVEFLSESYPQYLAQPNNPESLLNAINQLASSDTSEYRAYLVEKSKGYSIEKCIPPHLRACDIED